MPVDPVAVTSRPASGRPTRAQLSPSIRLYAAVVAFSILASLAGVLRVPAPVPSAYDEFAYLLQGQTFAHFRLTNPTPADWQAFETQQTLLVPSYTGKYPPAQGFVLAVGYWLGHPLYGVWLSAAVLAAAMTWMIRGAFAPIWALFGGLLTTILLGWACYWSQTYWGGAVAATGGALVFGATLRLLRARRRRDSAILGMGLIVLMLSRPFEGVLLTIALAASLGILALTHRWRIQVHDILRLAPPLILLLLAGAAFQLYYNFRVTGNPWRLPYLAYEHQYSGTPIFVWQHGRTAPTFRYRDMRDYYFQYVIPRSRFHEALPKVYLDRLTLVLNFFAGPLFTGIAILGFLLRPTRRAIVAAAAVLTGSCAFVLTTLFEIHYFAPFAAPLVFLSVHGVRSASLALKWERKRIIRTGALLLTLAVAFVYMDPRKSVDIFPQAKQRAIVLQRLRATGKHFLVFVRETRAPSLHFNWIHNNADFSRADVLWARDRGPEFNRRVMRDYAGRVSLLLTIDGDHLQFRPYAPVVPAKSEVTPKL